MRFIKKTASIVASLIIILAIGGYVFVRNFDLNRYKSYIEDIVRRETGRELKINGEASLGISFVPTLVVNDVEFANAPWASNEQMVKLQKLEITAAILPLLKGKIVVDKLILENPEIYLETNIDGEQNWVFMPVNNANDNKEQKNEQPKVKDATPVLAAGLIAKQVELTNGVVVYYDAKTNKTIQVDINNINLEIPSQDEILSLNVDAVFDGRNITLNLQADSLASILNQGKASFETAIKAMGINAEIRGAVEDILTSPRYAIEGNIYNPAGNFNIPETTLEMQADGTIDFADIIIKNLSIVNNKIEGKAYVDWSKNIPFVAVDLSAGLFDVNSIGNNSVLAFELPSIIKEANALEMVPNDKVPYEYLKMANGEAILSVGKLVLADDFVLNDIKAEAKLNDGNLNVKKFP